ncbi:sigma-70 family RNA polymerase sigma factor [Bacillus sp. JJ1609]|uniref:sigma-70 family RNA polymerase sigma factor n=1 Tax=Bacillus sp. JJ1609 TaxID=3122977 RepID=UPI002FFD7C96
MESFDQLALQYTPMMYKIIRSLNLYKNKDEFYQLALIGLWEAAERFDSSKGDFTNYAYSLIKGKIQNEMTKANKDAESTTTAKEEYWVSIEDEFATIPFEEDTLLSYCKSSQLTENQTKWVLYHFLKGFNIKDIAEIEQVSISAVKAWRAGAKEKLRKLTNNNLLF